MFDVKSVRFVLFCFTFFFQFASALDRNILLNFVRENNFQIILQLISIQSILSVLKFYEDDDFELISFE